MAIDTFNSWNNHKTTSVDISPESKDMNGRTILQSGIGQRPHKYDEMAYYQYCKVWFVSDETPEQLRKKFQCMGKIPSIKTCIDKELFSETDALVQHAKSIGCGKGVIDLLNVSSMTICVYSHSIA